MGPIGTIGTSMSIQGPHVLLRSILIQKRFIMFILGFIRSLTKPNLRTSIKAWHLTAKVHKVHIGSFFIQKYFLVFDPFLIFLDQNMFQNGPKCSEMVQYGPKASKSIQKPLKSLKKPPNASKSVQKPPKASKKCPKEFKSVHNHQKASQMVPNVPKWSQMLRKWS